MARKPTINSDSVAQDQIRAFVERIERMDEEIKALNDDKKEIFAEAKGNGFDTKALKIVIRKRAQDYGERMELEAIVELYEAALGMRAAPRDDDEEETGTVNANARAPAHATPEPSNMHDLHNASEPATDPKPVVAAAAVPPNSESEEGGTAGTGAALLATHMPETANDLPSGEPANAGGENEAVADDPITHGADLSADVVAHGNIDDVKRGGASETSSVSAVESGAPISPEGAPGKTGEATASPAPTGKKLKMNREFFDAPHPSCQRPEFCGGNSNLGLCEKCKAAAGMIPVVPGGVDIEHRGPVN